MARKIAEKQELPEALRFRFKEATIDTRLGDGDENRQKLALVASKMTDAPDDEDRPAALEKVHAFHSALEKVQRYVIESVDAAHAGVTNAQSVLGPEVAEAVRNVPQFGWPSAQDYAMAVESAKAKVLGRAMGSVVASTLERTREERAQLEAAAQAAGGDLEDWIDGARALKRAPRGITRATTLEDLSRVASVERDIRAQRLPAKYAYDLWTGFVQRGQLDAAEKIADGFKTLAIEIRDSTPAKLSTRYDGLRSGVVDEERQIAFRFLRDLDAFEEQKLKDSSIATASECLQLLAEVFKSLLGHDPKFLSRAQFDSAFLRTDSGKNDSAQPWAIASDWAQRYLPNSPFKLPGYAPIVMRTGNGVPVRGGR